MQSRSVDKTYRLKAMVFVRMFVEVSMMVLLIGIPITLQCLGRLHSLAFEQKVVFIALAVISVCVLPWYGFITCKVGTDLLGLTCISLFKKQFCAWSEIKAVSRRSDFNWLRYVIETKEGSTLNFPTLIKDCDALVEEIRVHLPVGSGGGSMKPSTSVFEHDQVASFMYLAQIVYGSVFIALTWSFYYSIRNSARTIYDAWIILFFCICITVLLMWRTFVVALMPYRIQVNAEKIILKTYFFKRSFSFAELKSLKKSSPFLPEGFMLKTTKGSYLIGANINSADELLEKLTLKIPLAKSKKPGPD